MLASDGSTAAGRAADFAASIALRYHAKVTLVYAAPPLAEHAGVITHRQALDRTGSDARTDFAGVARRLSEMGVTQVETEVIEGPATNVILGVAESYQPDLIVMGARGAGTWPGTILGSVSMAVTQRAVCPVLVVR